MAISDALGTTLTDATSNAIRALVDHYDTIGQHCTSEEQDEVWKAALSVTTSAAPAAGAAVGHGGGCPGNSSGASRDSDHKGGRGGHGRDGRSHGGGRGGGRGGRGSGGSVGAAPAWTAGTRSAAHAPHQTHQQRAASGADPGGQAARSATTSTVPSAAAATAASGVAPATAAALAVTAGAKAAAAAMAATAAATAAAGKAAGAAVAVGAAAAPAWTAGTRSAAHIPRQKQQQQAASVTVPGGYPSRARQGAPSPPAQHHPTTAPGAAAPGAAQHQRARPASRTRPGRTCVFIRPGKDAEVTKSCVTTTMSRLGTVLELKVHQREGNVMYAFVTFADHEAAQDACYTTGWGRGSWPDWHVDFARPKRHRTSGTSTSTTTVIELVATKKRGARPLHWTTARRHVNTFASESIGRISLHSGAGGHTQRVLISVPANDAARWSDAFAHTSKGATTHTVDHWEYALATTAHAGKGAHHHVAEQ